LAYQSLIRARGKLVIALPWTAQLGVGMTLFFSSTRERERRTRNSLKTKLHALNDGKSNF